MKSRFKHPAKKGFISIIIPVHDDVSGLTDTLNSLSKQTLPKSKYEVIVANDGARQDISKVCQSFNVKEVKITPNQGAYVARNQALKESLGEYLAFTDADVKVPQDWLEKGITHLQSSDYIGGPIHIDPQTINTTVDKYEALTAFPIKWMSQEMKFFPTANMLTKRVVFEETGLFNEQLRSGGDYELGQRIFHDTQYKQRYISELTVVHPTRGYTALAQKVNRVIQGQYNLHKKYPNKYPKPKYHTPGNIIHSLLNPIDLSEASGYTIYNKVKIYLTAIWFYLLHAYYSYKITHAA